MVTVLDLGDDGWSRL